MIGFHWNGWTVHKEGEYHCVDPGLVAMECEYLELVYGMVRAAKPALVFESGAGVSTHVLLAAQPGHVITVDPAPRVAPTQGLTIVEGKALDFLRSYEGPPFEFALLDSSEESKPLELDLLLREHLAPLGVVVLHDTGRKHEHLAEYRQAVADVCELHGASWIHFPKNRGVTVVQP